MPPLSSTAYETPDTTAYKTPEWAAAAVAEGKDPADVGSSNLALKIINGFTSLAAAAALTFTPVGVNAQGMISKEAFEKCEAELMANYADKIAKAQADGKPHLVPVYQKRLYETTEKICTLRADTAELKAGNVELDVRNAQLKAGNAELDVRNAELKAGNAELDVRNAELKAGNAELDVRNAELKAGNTLLAEANIITERIVNWKATSVDYIRINTIYTDLRTIQNRVNNPSFGIVLASLDKVRNFRPI